MDWNRRWAKQTGLSTREGHKAWADALENISRFCNEIGIKYLTVYAFSTENWKRSKQEVSALMAILKAHVDSFLRDKDYYKTVRTSPIAIKNKQRKSARISS